MKQQKTGSAQVTLTDDGLIHCVLNGYLTGTIVQGSMRRTRQFADQQHGARQPAKLLLDVSGVTGQTSSARLQAKDLGRYGFDKIAVCGANRVQSMIGRYIAKAGGMSSYTRFMESEAQARQWLHSRNTGHAISQRARAGWWIALATSALGALLLVGWITHTQLLTAGVPGLRPINPVAAVVMTLAVAGLLWCKVGRASLRQRVLLRSLAALCIVFGTLVVLRYATPIDVHVDQWLFSDRISDEAGPLRSRTATSLAVCIIGIGLLLALLAGRTFAKAKQWAFQIIAWIIYAISCYTLVAYSFGYEIGINGKGLMAVSATLMLFGAVTALQLRAPRMPAVKGLLRVTDAYWPTLAVTMILLCVTGIGWQVTNDRITQTADSNTQNQFDDTRDNLTKHFDAYLDVVRGFKAFFEASDFVSADDYVTYYDRTQVAQRYPGFYTIAFIRAINRDQLPYFTQQMNQGPPFSQNTDRTLTYQAYPATTDSQLWLGTYLTPFIPASLGFDVRTSSERLQVNERARDSGDAASSGVINFSNSRKESGQRLGVFISVPVYKQPAGEPYPTTVQGRRDNLYGFITAAFQNDTFFGGLFNANDKSNRYVLRNEASNAVLYDTDATAKLPANATTSTKLTVGGQTWDLSLYATPAAASGTSVLPHLILGSGLILTLISSALMISLTRRRERALSLAGRITEDLHIERDRAIASQKKNEAVLSSIGDAVFAIDTKQRITVFNKAAEAITGISQTEAMGKPYQNVLPFIHETTGKPSNQFIDRALKGKLTSMKQHTMLRRKDGSLVAVADSAAPIRDHKNAILGVIVVFRDVSKERQLDNAKTEFVSLASHQLRTPLSAINWYSEMLLNGDAGELNEEQADYLREIFEGNQRMIELVNSLLDVSRLDLGKFANAPQAIKLPAMLKDLECELWGQIEHKHLKYRHLLPPGVPVIHADPKLVRMIIQNLLSNAVKYTTDSGAVTATLRKATADDAKGLRTRSEGYVFFSVTDTGLGIPENQHGKIFGKLFRADNVRSLDVEGTGLGLYIVRQVVDKLGGRIWFTSTLGKGTTFNVVLPVVTKARK